MFDVNEIREWEDELHRKKMEELYPYQKKFKCPRKDKMKDHRKPDRYFTFGKEDTIHRRLFNRNYRAKVNHRVRTEQYDRIVKPSKTSGWLTW